MHPGRLPAFVPDPEIARATFDKYEAHLLLTRLHLPSPPTVLPGQTVESYPVMVKPRRGSGARSIHIAADRGQADFFVRYVDEDTTNINLDPAPAWMRRKSSTYLPVEKAAQTHNVDESQIFLPGYGPHAAMVGNHQTRAVRLQTQISRLRDDKRKLYSAMGQKVYALFQKDLVRNADLRLLCQQITNLDSQIGMREEELDQIRRHSSRRDVEGGVDAEEMHDDHDESGPLDRT